MLATSLSVFRFILTFLFQFKYHFLADNSADLVINKGNSFLNEAALVDISTITVLFFRTVYFVTLVDQKPPKSLLLYLNWFGPQHDKTNKVTVCPAKTQISLGFRQVWSESSLCAQWVAKDPSFFHADSKDSDQTGWMPRLIWIFAGAQSVCWFCHVAAHLCMEKNVKKTLCLEISYDNVNFMTKIGDVNSVCDKNRGCKLNIVTKIGDVNSVLWQKIEDVNSVLWQK